MMKRLRRAMVTRSASNSASASGLSTCLGTGHFLLLEQPEAVTRAVAEFVGAGVGPR